MNAPSPSEPGRLVIRASSLSTYLSACQLRMAVHSMPWLFRQHGYELRPARANIGALIGTACHAAGERGLREKMLAGTIIATSELEDAAIQALHERRREEADQAELVMDEQAPDLDTAERQARRMSRQYRDDVVTVVEPLAVERRIEAEFRPGVILSGQGDLLTLEKDQEGRVHLRDLKTTRRPQQPFQHAPQLGAYALLYATEGFEVDDAQIDLLRRTRIDKPQMPVEPQPLDIAACEEAAHAVMGEFADKAEAFAKDGNPSRFLPNSASFLCNIRFCRAHGCAVCPATRSLASNTGE